MIIAPLVFTTLVVGIAKMSDIKMIGRVGTKAMLWFISASLVSFHRIDACELAGTGTCYQTADSGCCFCRRSFEKQQSFSMEDFVKHMIPKSLFEAFATNEVFRLWYLPLCLELLWLI
jgi:Na+/H+-dicarboxylate symporter